jgi:anaerobic magnesium-protoporphyrin IX monomethyl ester cyclase
MKTAIVALYPYLSGGLDYWHDHGAGMTYMAAKTAGCDVTFVDMKRFRNDDELRESLRGFELVAFGLKSSYYHIGMRIISIAKSLGAKVMVGGYHASAAPWQLTENKNIDWILRGESEITFPKFLKNPAAFPREMVGEKPPNLDVLHWIDRNIYANPIEDCGGWWYTGYKRMLSVIAARGCPYRCGFCQPIEDVHFGKKLRRRSVDSLIAELKCLKQIHKPECIMIHDDTFFIQNKWLEEFIEKYPQIGLPFWAAAKSDGICNNPDLFKRVVKVGWDLVSVGFESGSQRILDKIQKDVTVEQNIEAAKIIKSTGAKIYANYIYGFPWEVKEDVQATAKMIDTIGAEMPSTAFFTPYPGCELGEECIDNGWSLLDRNHYDRCPMGEKVMFVDYKYIDQVVRGFREDAPKLLTDIIIPTYKNEKYTISCLNSIKQNTKEGTYRIIWIDNGSGRESTNQVDAVLKNMQHISLKLPRNEGFVGAVNEGFRISTAPNICLLNNDTEVTPRWMDKLLAILSDPTIGIVGPLTGYGKFGPDSQHSLMLHPSLLPPESRGWSTEKLNEVLESTYPKRVYCADFVAFLCAIIKREVFEAVSKSDKRYAFGLDTNYDMGMWDDLDYNLQTRKLGWDTLLVLDTCIMHKGRSTFNLIKQSEGFDVDELLKKNRKYLDSKFTDREIAELIKGARRK